MKFEDFLQLFFFVVRDKTLCHQSKTRKHSLAIIIKTIQIQINMMRKQSHDLKIKIKNFIKLMILKK